MKLLQLFFQDNGINAYSPAAIPLTHEIMPQAMKRLGYQTHMIGKWHQVRVSSPVSLYHHSSFYSSLPQGTAVWYYSLFYYFLLAFFSISVFTFVAKGKELESRCSFRKIGKRN